MSVVAAEFPSPEALLAGAEAAKKKGLALLEAYTPYPVPEIDRHLGIPRSRVSRDALIGGLLGVAFAYLLQWWCTAIDFPLDVGGRPLHSAPAFIPISFETTVLFAAAAAFGGVIVRSGLPAPYHPVFEIDGFESATGDGHWLAVETGELAVEEAAETLRGLGARRVERMKGAGR